MTKFPIAAIAAILLLLSGCAAPALKERLTPMQEGAVSRFFNFDTQTSPSLDTSWTINQAPVRFSSPDGQGGGAQDLHIGGRATLSVENHPVPDQYKITWHGQRDSHGADPTQITLLDAAGARALVIEFENDRLRVISAQEDTFPRLTYAIDRKHTVTVNVNMTSRPTVAVDIREGRTPIHTSPPRPVLDSGFRGLSRIEVSVASEQTVYHLSGLEIAEVQ